MIITEFLSDRHYLFSNVEIMFTLTCSFCVHPDMGPGPHDKDALLAAIKAEIANVSWT